MYKCITIRLYPNQAQELLFYKSYGCYRYIYNYFLNLQEVTHQEGGKYISCFQMMGLLTKLKSQPEYNWLYEVGNRTLQGAIKDLDFVYKLYFQHVYKNHPRFKKKKENFWTCPTNNENFYFSDRRHVNIEKIGKVKCKYIDDPPIGRGQKYQNVRIVKRLNKWLLIASIEIENQDFLTLSDYSMGIDVGLKSTMVVAYNNQKIVYPNINTTERIVRLEEQIKFYDRKMCRLYLLNQEYIKEHKHITNNMRKIQYKIDYCKRRLKNIREDYYQKIVAELIQYAPKRIVIEDLNVAGMYSLKTIARSLHAQGLGKLLKIIKTAAIKAGIPVVEASQWFPSSKMCSNCGSKKDHLRLKDRVFVCSECGLIIDRDYNAAINLSKYIE